MRPALKIAIIIPYFGQWPGWIDYFFLTCRKNPSVDWLFPTDCTERETSGSNLKFIPFSLREFNDLASNTLDLDIDIQHPYKICEFKPAFGEIFNDYIREYDFWGYGDLDLVYGDVRDFFPDTVLNRYDILSNHPDLITGHFCLLRNTPQINGLFRTGNVFRSAFQDDNYTGFDERLKRYKINPDPRYIRRDQDFDRNLHLVRYRLIKRLKELFPNRRLPGIMANSGSELADFSSIVGWAEHEGLVRVRYSRTFESDLMLAKRGQKDWEIRWNNGTLSNSEGDPLLYFHFILSKKLETFAVPQYQEGIQEFRLTPDGISW
jgi:hypothetical protein